MSTETCIHCGVQVIRYGWGVVDPENASDCLPGCVHETRAGLLGVAK